MAVLFVCIRKNVFNTAYSLSAKPNLYLYLFAQTLWFCQSLLVWHSFVFMNFKFVTMSLSHFQHFLFHYDIELIVLLTIDILFSFSYCPDSLLKFLMRIFIWWKKIRSSKLSFSNRFIVSGVDAIYWVSKCCDSILLLASFPKRSSFSVLPKYLFEKFLQTNRNLSLPYWITEIYDEKKDGFKFWQCRY